MTLTPQQQCDIGNGLRTDADGFRRTAIKLSEKIGTTGPQAEPIRQFIAMAEKLESLAWDIEEAELVKIERKETQK